MRRMAAWCWAMGATIALFGGWSAATGCADRSLGTVTPEVQHGFEMNIVQPGEAAVDLLVVIDDSQSMHDEQVNLADNFQHLVRSLTSPADEDGDGEPDHAPVTNLHVGIVSTDLGVLGAAGVPHCGGDGHPEGDDGRLISTPRTSEVAGCAASYPPFLSYDPDGTADDVLHTPEELDAAFQCLAMLGTDGCGYEQQLEAMARALDVHGTGAGANGGFVRDDSLLAIVMLTDEEDCSVRPDDPNSVDLFSNAAFGNPNLRCFRHGANYLTPVDAFVDRLLALRAGRPDKLVFAGIVGIPLETACPLTDMGEADFACVLAEPRMQQVEAGNGNELEPACRVEGRGKADPARRIVEAIRGVDRAGGSGIVRSICEGDFRPAMEAISRLIQKQFDGACLARPLERNRDGQVACRVVETLATADACPAGRLDLGLQGGRRVCQVCQLGDGETGNERDVLGNDLSPCAPDVAAGHYWHYAEDATGCEDGGIVFEGDAVAVAGSQVDLECLSSVDETPGGPVGE